METGLPADLTDGSVAELRQAIVARRCSVREVATAFIDRIEALDRDGPAVNAILELNPAALDIAHARDARLNSDDGGAALYGIPVVLKANIDTADEMATSAGSLALARHRALQDAPLVAKLRAAGAVVLGKTNLSEWANFRSTASISGWSSLGGQTRNPHAPDRSPSGSSSGSAVAVAARLAPPSAKWIGTPIAARPANRPVRSTTPAWYACTSTRRWYRRSTAPREGCAGSTTRCAEAPGGRS